MIKIERPVHFHKDHTCHLDAIHIPRKYTPSRLIHLRRSILSNVLPLCRCRRKEKKRVNTRKNYFYNGTTIPVLVYSHDSCHFLHLVFYIYIYIFARLQNTNIFLKRRTKKLISNITFYQTLLIVIKYRDKIS